MDAETHESSYQQQFQTKYDYGTDNEDEKEFARPEEEGNSGYLRMKINQTEICQDDFNNFLHRCTLTLPPQLSQKFVRLSKEFNNNIDYIMNYVYKLVGNSQMHNTSPTQSENNLVAGPPGIAEKNKFHSKYENLIK